MAADVETRGVAAASVTLGAGISAFLFWLLYFREPSAADSGHTLAFLPAFNASCNALSAAFLGCGYAAIRRKNVRVHMRLMAAALACSALFLVGYVTHHTLHGDTRFPGIGAIRATYLTLLASHVLLSIVALPMILATVYYALARRFPLHRRIARLTFPVWLYVSITGVAVYLFLRAYV